MTMFILICGKIRFYWSYWYTYTHPYETISHITWWYADVICLLHWVYPHCFAYNLIRATKEQLLYRCSCCNRKKCPVRSIWHPCQVDWFPSNPITRTRTQAVQRDSSHERSNELGDDVGVAARHSSHSVHPRDTALAHGPGRDTKPLLKWIYKSLHIN